MFKNLLFVQLDIFLLKCPTHMYLDLVQAKLIRRFLSRLLLMVDQDGPQVGLDDVGPPHVAHPEEKVKAAVDETNNGGLREGHSVGTFLKELCCCNSMQICSACVKHSLGYKRSTYCVLRRAERIMRRVTLSNNRFDRLK